MQKSKPSISVIIPTYNEVDNVAELARRLDVALVSAAIPYELIFVDDHSNDGTINLLTLLTSQYPAVLHMKKGEKGKAFSLIEGFEKSRYPYIAMIDADLQYPPESIPEMLNAVLCGHDIVVGDRNNVNVGPVRRTLSRIGRSLYGEWLHDLDCDVQSGLKVFRKEVLSYVSLNPTSWTFDLEFLVKARQADFKIASVKIPFSVRVAGESKINIFQSGLEIMVQSIKMKFRDTKEVTPQLISDNKPAYKDGYVL